MAQKKPVKKSKKPLTSSMEDYLEAIFEINKEKSFVRVKDIAKKMNVKMPTVTSMLKNLRDRELVKYEKYEFVELTRSGANIGREMRRRHDVLLSFLMDILRIDHETADDEACKMEHTLSVSTLQRFIDFMDFIQVCPRAGEEWLNQFEEYRKSGKKLGKCLDETSDRACEVVERHLKAKKS
ncbi:MAG: DtxR family iron (metal) dependent repressor [Deltaproteobacteria bacterium]|nr:MAG: DtxR family iron (metal) dependent repressor [Deltaproteobacteria bacterium]